MLNPEHPFKALLPNKANKIILYQSSMAQVSFLTKPRPFKSTSHQTSIRCFKQARLKISLGSPQYVPKSHPVMVQYGGSATCL